MEEMKHYQTLSAKAVLSLADPGMCLCRAGKGREGRGPLPSLISLSACPQEVLRRHRLG